MSTSRKITNIYQADFGVYDLEGPIQEDIRLLNLGYDRKKVGTRCGWRRVLKLFRTNIGS